MSPEAWKPANFHPGESPDHTCEPGKWIATYQVMGKTTSSYWCSHGCGRQVVQSGKP